MYFYINKEGYFKVTGVWNQNKCNEIITKMQNKISQGKNQRNLFDKNLIDIK